MDHRLSSCCRTALGVLRNIADGINEEFLWLTLAAGDKLADGHELVRRNIDLT